MLRIHFSNRLETLSARLVNALRQPTASAQALWQACPVVVPSAGIQRRLTLDLADGLGICTQVQFSYLAQWLWSLMARHLSGVSQRSPLEVGPLSWRIDALFQDAPWVNGYPRLASYLKAADDLMRFQLAEQVARLLETYATFRPDWGARWRHGETVLDEFSDPLGDEGWQSSLWQQLSDDLALDDHHPAQAFVRWLTQMYETGQRPPGLPERVHVVALPSMPPLHLQVLQALAMGCDVEIYALNPCQEYWFDVVDPRRLAWLSRRALKPGSGHRSMHPSASTWAHLDVGHPLLAGWDGKLKPICLRWCRPAEMRCWTMPNLPTLQATANVRACWRSCKAPSCAWKRPLHRAFSTRPTIAAWRSTCAIRWCANWRSCTTACSTS